MKSGTALIATDIDRRPRPVDRTRWIEAFYVAEARASLARQATIRPVDRRPQ